jgi:hypothetical protein
MPSKAYHDWKTRRARALDEIAQAHAAVGGPKRGRRYTTQQINQAYAVLLASQFQGYCRALHTECVRHLLSVLALPSELQAIVEPELTRGRQLDRGNAQSASLGIDFGRLGINFWTAVDHHDPSGPTYRQQLDLLNAWRNAIAHQDFDPGKLGGMTQLRLAQVKKWRALCKRIARAIDAVMREHLQKVTQVTPW